MREVYADRGPPIYVCGYASIFNETYSIGDGRLERVMPDAFDIVTPVYATFTHSQHIRYGTTSDRSLKIWADSIGLAFQFRLGPDWHSFGLATSIASGTFRACSLYFTERKILRVQEGDRVVEQVVWARISEVSVCVRGANPWACCWLDSEDPAGLEPFLATMRAQWRAGQQRAVVKAHARRDHRPPKALLESIGRLVDAPRPRGWGLGQHDERNPKRRRP